MNRLLSVAIISAFATLLFAVSFLVYGIGSPLTWATIAGWAVADCALVATIVGNARANLRPGLPPPTPPPAERRAAARLIENIGQIAASRSLPAKPGTTVVLLDNGRNKIAVIKALREALNTGLKEAKDLADAAERSPAVVAAGLAPAEAERLLRELHAAGGRAEIQ